MTSTSDTRGQSYCLWRTADLQLAEDATAAPFLETWRKRERLELTTESEDVEVRLQGDRECVFTSIRFTMCCETRGSGDSVSYLARVRTMTRGAWRWTKKNDRKWKKLRVAAEEAEARSQAAAPPK